MGQTDISVSRLCFGTLTVGPAQSNLPLEQAAEIIAYAAGKGVNFLDTAELYDNYELIRLVEKKLQKPLVVATKTYAYSSEQAKKSLEQARKGMDRDKIDIFLLHEQESTLTMSGHSEAFAYLLDQKEKGLIRAIGLSTHAVEPVRALVDARSKSDDASSVWKTLSLDPGPYQYADVIHPLVNMKGIGVLDGNARQMADACQAAAAAGIGLYGMKALGGGHLLSQFDKAIDYVKALTCLTSVAIGMQSKEEVDINTAIFNDQLVDVKVIQKTLAKKRVLKIEDWCSGCGRCVKRCGEKALSMNDNKAVVKQEKCVFCGYCATVCRDFAIKIF